MLRGSDVLIITKDEARVLVKSLAKVMRIEWTKKNIRMLQKMGALDVVSELRKIAREDENE